MTMLNVVALTFLFFMPTLLFFLFPSSHLFPFFEFFLFFLLTFRALGLGLSNVSPFGLFQFCWNLIFSCGSWRKRTTLGEKLTWCPGQACGGARLCWLKCPGWEIPTIRQRYSWLDRNPRIDAVVFTICFSVYWALTAGVQVSLCLYQCQCGSVRVKPSVSMATYCLNGSGSGSLLTFWERRIGRERQRRTATRHDEIRVLGWGRVKETNSKTSGPPLERFSSNAHQRKIVLPSSSPSESASWREEYLHFDPACRRISVMARRSFFRFSKRWGIDSLLSPSAFHDKTYEASRHANTWKVKVVQRQEPNVLKNHLSLGTTTTPS